MQNAKAFGVIVNTTAGWSRKVKVALTYGADFSIKYSEPVWEVTVEK